MRIALGVEYNGTHFKGWESQPGHRTVQACLEKALSKVANTAIKVIAAGRTDTGVHAMEQVVHFDTEVSRETHGWMLGANSSLPKDIAVHWAQGVSDDFHARFSAVARRYRYLILNRRARPGVLSGNVSWCPLPLDVERMHGAAQALLGEQDFNAYRATACQSPSARRRMNSISVTRDRDTVIIEVEANAFLHHMVRNIAGVLIAIGTGARSPSWAAEVLASKDRRQGGITASPDGLYLVEAKYPASAQLPQRGGAGLGFQL